MITIHYDFTDGSEVSYVEGLALLDKGNSFTTHCLDFFQFDYGDVTVLSSKGYIIMQELLDNIGEYTDKHIRREHNLRKILVAGGFKWKVK